MQAPMSKLGRCDARCRVVALWMGRLSVCLIAQERSCGHRERAEEAPPPPQLHHRAPPVRPHSPRDGIVAADSIQPLNIMVLSSPSCVSCCADSGPRYLYKCVHAQTLRRVRILPRIDLHLPRRDRPLPLPRISGMSFSSSNISYCFGVTSTTGSPGAVVNQLVSS